VAFDANRLAWAAVRAWMSVPGFKGRDRVFLAMRRHLRPPLGLVSFRSADGFQWELDLSQEVDASMYMFGSYEPESLAVMTAVLEPGTDAVDVGANVGLLTVGMARAATPGRVLAFEPSPMSFERLSRNLGLNGCANALALPLALSARPGRGLLTVATAHRSGDDRLVAAATPGTPVHDVRLDTLDAVCLRERLTPRLVKVDVEGAEWGVLRGARRVLATGPCLLVEANSAASAGSHHPFEVLTWLAERFGYRFRMVNPSALAEFDLTSRAVVNRNILGARDDRTFELAARAVSRVRQRSRFEIWPASWSG
jgi:FkbM family methyltransferase